MKRCSFSTLFSFILLASGCVEPYEPSVKNKDVDFLVVNSFINSTEDSVYVVLTHTTDLQSSDPPRAETSASVILEDDQQRVINIPEIGNGIYGAKNLELNSERRYRLNINTVAKNAYQSDFTTLKVTPDLENISWVTEGDELYIVVNTQNNSGSASYFRWNYSETYEYSSPYASAYKIVNGVVENRPQDEMTNQCWRTDDNKRIILNATTLLSQDVIRDFRILSIKRNSIKINKKYSIEIRLQSLSEEGYTYWLNLQKSTESLGGLFDPLPSKIQGNIRCLTNPGEPVIGYFDGGEISKKRIFITPDDLPRGFSTYSTYGLCDMDTIKIDQLSSVVNGNSILGPIYTTNGFPVLVGYLRTSIACTDCRIYGGGDLLKPDYWE
jgi:hypothetical protein